MCRRLLVCGSGLVAIAVASDGLLTVPFWRSSLPGAADTVGAGLNAIRALESTIPRSVTQSAVRRPEAELVKTSDGRLDRTITADLKRVDDNLKASKFGKTGVFGNPSRWMLWGFVVRAVVTGHVCVNAVPLSVVAVACCSNRMTGPWYPVPRLCRACLMPVCCLFD